MGTKQQAIIWAGLRRAAVWNMAVWLLVVALPTWAGNVTQICPPGGIQPRGATYEPGGIILVAFDRTSLWVYNITTDRRYPLPDTHPCGRNCRLSPDSQWVTYIDPDTSAYSKMHLDGTGRAPMIDYASDIEWWMPDTLLVWTPGHQAYLQPEAGGEREYLDVEGVINVQPGGRWGLLEELDGDTFSRALVNLDMRDLHGVSGGYIPLGPDVSYFNAASWSPDGNWLAYVMPGAYDPQAQIAGGEIYSINPADGTPVQWTDLNSLYGAARINGHASDLSWSPDGRLIAFWVIELLGPNPEANTGNAVIHILDTQTGDLRVYCGFTITEHTPNPPRLLWSPDSTHLTFGGNIPGDDKGYLLLALDIETGVFTELSNGIYPTFDTADPVAWGLPPQ
ncbi:MAG: PD40 domain-containing protein [Anaerolineaceae bacterium]|nr:PD40 domain-containing protein [Anaerolineaceae bacterium]